MDVRGISKGEWKKTTHTRKLLSICLRKMRRPVFKQMFQNTGNHVPFPLEQNRFKIPYAWIHSPFHCLPDAYVSFNWWREWTISGTDKHGKLSEGLSWPDGEQGVPWQVYLLDSRSQRKNMFTSHKAKFSGHIAR